VFSEGLKSGALGEIRTPDPMVRRDDPLWRGRNILLYKQNYTASR